ncbi:MAG: DUF427 domain-containing protein [Caulobacter sp.]
MTQQRLKFAPAEGRVRALFEGHEIADTADALVLREGDYPPVVYFPREDVEMAVLRKTDHTTRCPHKGVASYYTIYRDRQIIENAAWSYESPIEGAELIAGRIAFYPEHVDIQAGDQGTNNAAVPDDSSPDTPRPGGVLRTGAPQSGEAQSLDGPVRVPPHDPPYADIDPMSRG